jgi:hypothetical protein
MKHLIQKANRTENILREAGEHQTADLIHELIIAINEKTIISFTGSIQRIDGVVTVENNTLLLNCLKESLEVLLWCERRMMSPSLSKYPREAAQAVQTVISKYESF